jgi:ketosteroid isomerase-like protein
MSQKSAMPHEVLAREAYEAFNRGDWDAMLEVCTPDIAVQRAGGAGIVRGREALREFSTPDAFERQQLEPKEFIDHGDRLFVALQARAIGSQSGIEVEQEGFHVLTIHARKIARLEIYFGRTEALQAVRSDGVARPLRGE